MSLSLTKDELIEVLKDRIQTARDIAGWKESHGDMENATMRNDWANGMQAALEEVRKLKCEDSGDEAAIKRLQDKGSMPKSSETAPDCLQCMNGKTLANEEKCNECGRYVDNYGELFPLEQPPYDPWVCPDRGTTDWCDKCTMASANEGHWPIRLSEYKAHDDNPEAEHPFNT